MIPQFLWSNRCTTTAPEGPAGILPAGSCPVLWLHPHTLSRNIPKGIFGSCVPCLLLTFPMQLPAGCWSIPRATASPKKPSPKIPDPKPPEDGSCHKAGRRKIGMGSPLEGDGFFWVNSSLPGWMREIWAEFGFQVFYRKMS